MIFSMWLGAKAIIMFVDSGPKKTDRGLKTFHNGPFARFVYLSDCFGDDPSCLIPI